MASIVFRSIYALGFLALAAAVLLTCNAKIDAETRAKASEGEKDLLLLKARLDRESEREEDARFAERLRAFQDGLEGRRLDDKRDAPGTPYSHALGRHIALLLCASADTLKDTYDDILIGRLPIATPPVSGDLRSEPRFRSLTRHAATIDEDWTFIRMALNSLRNPRVRCTPPPA